MPQGRNKISIIGIIVEDQRAAPRVNALLSEYGEHIIGRMGVPYKDKGISIISVALDAPAEFTSALSGKLGMIEGVSAKTVSSKKEY